MADLLNIKHRIDSVTTTKKITKAMELVATAKLGRTKNDYDKIKIYYDRVQSIFDNLMVHSEEIEKTINVEGSKNGVPKSLYIIIGSDLGLCGAYNANLVKLVKENINKDSLMIVIGSKMLNAFKKYDNQIIQSFIKIGDTLEYSLAQVISKKIYDTIQEIYVKDVNIIYTEYINSITTNPVIKQIYPIKEKTQTSEVPKIDLSIYEPSPSYILASSFGMYFEAEMYLALGSSKLSEMSSRRTAMESATDNAEELIKKLQLSYNRTRQAKITEELTEIISGSSS
ncbi:ATP synthase F1 subunit gamma [Mycoplasma phocoenae]|uniref:ATP synthase gamma chain n=1 Tax=Mycoplasma phocoenae TaxID=754517 RepID=A0A858U3K7_9MOLU|nr:ATP synthase F1 subunit gamma [Mycoplasma phocoenae]QJG67002.1 ATP synthase F1 subunit gamma [Mycoplasma phocoenae]